MQVFFGVDARGVRNEHNRRIKIFFLRLQLRQTKVRIFIYQEKFTYEKIKKFGMENTKKIVTHMASNLYLYKDEKGKLIREKLCRSILGSLLYLLASRSNILFSVCLCVQFLIQSLKVTPLSNYLHL